jgi:hypothetical protein
MAATASGSGRITARKAAASDGDQPQRSGKRNPGPGVQLHRLILATIGARWWAMLAGQRYGIVTACRIDNTYHKAPST